MRLIRDLSISKAAKKKDNKHCLLTSFWKEVQISHEALESRGG